MTGTFERKTFSPRAGAEVFAFFADASNLARLTPEWLKFTIETPTPVDMGRGAVIDYTIRIYGIPMRWRTLITEWEPPFRFVDEQVYGPYRYWRHEHTFDKSGDGTLLGDRVEYAAPFGALADRVFVRGNLRRIFDHRSEVLCELFDARPCI